MRTSVLTIPTLARLSIVAGLLLLGIVLAALVSMLVAQPFQGWVLLLVFGCNGAIVAFFLRREATLCQMNALAVEGFCTLHNGIIIQATKRMADQFGYTPAQMRGKEFFHLLARETHGTVGRVLTGGQSACEARGIRQDGSEFPIECLSDCHLVHGQLNGVVSIRDISTRKAVEHDLLDLEAAMRTMYSIASDGTMHFEQRATAMLRMGCAFFQLPVGVLARVDGERSQMIAAYAPEQALLKNAFAPLSAMFCSATLRSTEPFAIPSLSLSPWRNDPVLRDQGFEAYIGMRLIVNGRLFGTLTFCGSQARRGTFSESQLGLVRLIAHWLSHELEQQQAEQALRQQEALLARVQSEHKAMFEATSEAMAMIDSDGRVTNYNQRFAELFRLPHTNGQQHPAFRDVLNHADIEPAQVAICVGLMPGSSQAITIPLANELHVFSVSATAIKTHASHVGRLYTLRDTTYELEADRIKSDFVAMVSHELRSPLTSIKGYTDILLDEDLNGAVEPQKVFLEIIKTSADRLVRLINDLLDFAKIEAEAIHLRCGWHELTPIVYSAADLLRPLIDEKQQTIQIDPLNHLPPVWCDADRLLQVMLNPLSNAQKYTAEGGMITVRSRLVHEAFEIDVEDNGIGISVEDQDRVFRKFFRAQNRATRENSGTGLGLSISSALVELHGGRITVQSVPNKGSIFTIALPAVPIHGHIHDTSYISRYTQAV